MAVVPKEVVRPGTYWYADRVTGLPRKLVVTRPMVDYWFDQGKKMLAAGLSVPVPLEHQEEAYPLTPAQKAAKQLLNNAGFVSAYEMRGDQLWSLLDIQDPEVEKKLPRTIRWTSPWINSFTDGNGTKWDGVISHVALTTRPRITRQTPFQSVSAAMSYLGGTPDLPFDPAKILPGPGVTLSRAGLLDRGADGNTLTPTFPLAFSLYSGGVSLAGEFPPPKKDDARPPVKKDGDKPPPPEPDPNADPNAALERQLVDGDGDISVYDVLVDLLAAVGITLPGGTAGENFAQRLYEAAMEKVKATGSGADKPPAPPPGTPPPGAKPPGSKPPPPVQEQPPMYMSLTADAIAAITDPEKKQVAEAFFSLRQQAEASKQFSESLAKKALADALAARQARVERLMKNLPQSARDALNAQTQAQGMQLSLGADGSVSDPMKATLDILEAGLGNLPDLLLNPQARFSELPHPPDANGGGMTEERRRQVVEEVCAAGGIPAPPASK